MITEPDGLEVVAARADAEGLELPPLLILEEVRSFLDAHGIGEGAISWQRIGEGQSNITYLIERGGRRVVLRRGPRPPLPRSTHDMLREARVQQSLAKIGFPVPQILAVCSEETVLGVPFYVSEYLEGVIVLDETPAVFDSPEARRAISEAAVDTLIRLHGLDYSAAGLGDFGRPDGYLQRQVATFTSLSRSVSERRLPLIDELSDWLERRRPESRRSSLVHGDFRLGNLMFEHAAPVRVLALFDWEMATLGDPLADLGYLTATYSDHASPGTIMELTGATKTGGYLSAEELAARYAGATGLDVSDLPWYQALALWKASIFCEAIYTRWLRGEKPGDTFASQLEVEVPRMLEAARDYSGLLV
jgi:aminoglycoside phosphotransferase (APT) family kinase protein